WDLATAQPRCAPLQHQGSVLSLSFRPDGKTLLTGSKDRAARLWDVSTGLRIGPLLVHEGPVLAAFRPGSADMLTFSADGFLRRWNWPAPATQEARSISHWVEALTGKELTTTGILKELDAGMLRERRRNAQLR